jgi:3-mercaptopyruvate sulfurtransferase SseA
MLNQRAGNERIRALLGGWNDWVAAGGAVTKGTKP